MQAEGTKPWLPLFLFKGMPVLKNGLCSLNLELEALICPDKAQEGNIVRCGPLVTFVDLQVDRRDSITPPGGTPLGDRGRPSMAPEAVWVNTQTLISICNASTSDLQ